ncbi:NfeD family protein [Gilvimarinus sp. DA14]|uniref:NfeD family protein n=1 Tax=Gilvimarinus sp. DA14 TaxID=2956798 RepID=UPI0020B761B4|nr:NfeD family protein [Gilvimarinus sp. DA14]UTF59896.1 NfeD family protein [Gilvimarinus sp. DA14]
MGEWLQTGLAPWIWIVFGIALSALEILLPSFFMLWLGVSAIVVGLVTWLVPLSLALQLLLWIVLSFLSLLAWFKWIAPRMKDKTLSGMAMEKAVGQIGTVLNYTVSTQRGILRFPAPVLGEDEWRFICTSDLQPGDRVIVMDFSGNDLIVKPKA